MKEGETNRKLSYKNWDKKRTVRILLICLMCLALTIGARLPYRPADVAEDPSEDYILDHPIFEEHFEVRYVSNEVIPSALDIKKVTLTSEGDVHRFRFETSGDIKSAFQKYANRIQFGVFIDKDHNGASDILISTTSKMEESAVMTSEFRLIERGQLIVEDNSLEVSVSRDLAGDEFDWSAFTGFALPPGQSFLTPISDVFIAPVVDIAYFSLNHRVLIESKILVTSEGLLMVPLLVGKKAPPPESTPRDGDAGGPTGCRGKPINDWLLNTQKDDSLVVQLWVISTNPDKGVPSADFFAKKVFKDENNNGKQDPGEPGGWVARCPYKGGQNEQQKIDDDGDDVPDRIKRTVTDGTNSDGSDMDTDRDGKKDSIIYQYDVNNNQVTVTNRERDANGNLIDSRSTSPRSPYDDPVDVPTSVE